MGEVIKLDPGDPYFQAPPEVRATAWCRLCGEPVRLSGPEVMPELRRAVHAATGLEKGPGHGDEGWHIAMPSTENPVLRAEADALEAEFGGRFSVSARFGFFRADWRDVPAGVTAAHYEASTAGEMRQQLRAVTRAFPASAEPAP